MFYPRIVAWSVWVLASLFYAYQYILRVMPNIMMGDLTGQFHIDAAIFGQFSGIYYIGYSLMHLPIGLMFDRYGPKKIMTVCIILTVIGLLPILFADHWIYPLLGRGLIGIGSSAAILSTFKIIRMSFDARYFSRMLSFSVMIGLIGAVYGGGPVSYLCTLWGYQKVIKLFAVLGLSLAVLTYLIVPNSKSTSPSTGVWADVKTIITHRTIMLFCFFAGLMLGPLEGFADVWGSGFFQQVYGFDTKTANYLPSMIFIGMCFAPVLSLIAEKTGYYLGTIIASGCIMAVLFCAFLLQVLTVWTLDISLLLIGLCCSYQILVIYKVTTYAPERLVCLATAIANMVIMMFCYAFHSLIGLLVNAYGGTSEAKAFIYGVSIIPLGLLFGVLGFLYLSFKEQKRCLS